MSFMITKQRNIGKTAIVVLKIFGQFIYHEGTDMALLLEMLCDIDGSIIEKK